MGFDRAGETASSKKKSTKYINLEEDGDSAIFTIQWSGATEEFDPYVHEQIWNDKTDRFETFTAAHKAAGKEPNFRYFFTVYGKSVTTREGTKDIDDLQVYQCTPGTLKEIMLIRDKHGDLSKIFIEVKRHGAKGSKKTQYKAMFDSHVDEELKAKIQKMDRFDLRKEAQRDSTSSSNSNGESKENSGKIADSVADELLSRLRQLPDAKRDSFLPEFKISRVRDLPAAQTDAARAFIAKLEGKTAEKDDRFA